MKRSIKVSIVCIIAALIIGLIVTQTLFTTVINRDSNTRQKPFLGIANDGVRFDTDVVYVSFSTRQSGIANLFKRSNDYNIPGNFLVILNVTNHSNIPMAVSALNIAAAEKLLFTRNIYSTNYPFFDYQQIYEPQSRLYSSDDLILHPYESRLIALTGATKFSNDTSLQAGTFYVGSEVAYSIDDGYLYLAGREAKMINVEKFGDEYIYNNLFAENEQLRISSSGLTVEIVSKK